MIEGRKEGRNPLVSFGKRRACVDFTPYINSSLISTHFKRLELSEQSL
jgi:hypothetical protein